MADSNGAWFQDQSGTWTYVDKYTQEPLTPPAGEAPPSEVPQAPAPVPQAPAYDPSAAYVPSQAAPSLIPGGLDDISQSSSTSYTGTSKADRDAFGTNVAAGSAQVEGDVNAQANAAGQALYDASLRDQRAVIGDEAYAQAPSMYDAQAAQLQAQTEQAARLAQEQSRLIRVEAAAQAAAERHVDMVGADYMGQVQQLAAMRVNPGQWWGNLDSGEKGATMAAVFVANFLGMSGHSTTVMDSITRAIDRNIDAQSQNIANKGEVAGMYKTMYDMAVSQSSSQEEARARMRGLYIAQIQQDIAVELGRYDAPLAMAKAAESRAALDMAFEKNLADLKATWWDRGMTAKQLIVEQERAKLNAAQKSSSRSTSTSMSAAPVPQGGGADPRIKDFNELAVTDPQTGKVIGKARTKEEAQTYRAKNGAVVAFLDAGVKLRNLMANVDSMYGGNWGEASLNSEHQRAVRAARQDLLSALALARSGKALTEKELVRYEEMVPLDTWLTREGVDEIYNGLIQRSYDSYRLETKATQAELSPEEQKWVDQGVVQGGLQHAFGEAHNAATNEGKPAETEGSRAQAQYKAKDSNREVTVPAGSLAGSRAAEAGISGLNIAAAKAAGKGKDPTRVPDWFLGLSNLVDSNPGEALTTMQSLEDDIRLKGDKTEEGNQDRLRAFEYFREVINSQPVKHPDDDREVAGGNY